MAFILNAGIKHCGCDILVADKWGSLGLKGNPAGLMEGRVDMHLPHYHLRILDFSAVQGNSP